MEAGDLFSVLKKLQSTDISYSEVSGLIMYTVRIAHAFLKCRYAGFSSKMKTAESEWKDIAVDSVVPLFIRKNGNGSYELASILSSWKAPVTNNVQAQFFLHKIVWERVDQHMIRVLREIDPVFSKIRAVFNYYIEKYDYGKISYFGITYICENGSNTQPGRLIDFDSFDQLPFDLFSGVKDRMLDKIFTYIRNNTNYQPAIPFNALVERVKRLHGMDLAYSCHSSSADFQELIAIDEIANSAYDSAVKKLDEFYSSKGKLTDEEIDNFKRLLVDILEDMKDGGISGSLYEYFSKYLPAVDKEEYYEKYHNVLDYLVRIMKSNMKNELAGLKI